MPRAGRSERAGAEAATGAETRGRWANPRRLVVGVAAALGPKKLADFAENSQVLARRLTDAEGGARRGGLKKILSEGAKSILTVNKRSIMFSRLETPARSIKVSSVCKSGGATWPVLSEVHGKWTEPGRAPTRSLAAGVRARPAAA